MKHFCESNGTTNFKCYESVDGKLFLSADCEKEIIEVSLCPLCRFQPERSKREEARDYTNCEWNAELTYDPGCNSKHPLAMRCSEHCGNTVRDK